MTLSRFDENQLQGGLSLENMNNQDHSVFQGDSKPLRPSAQDTQDMTVKIEAAKVENYYNQAWGNTQPLDFAGGNSPVITAPASDSRIDILYLTEGGGLSWVTGVESATPVPDWASLPPGGIAICLVFCKITMTKIVNYQDKDAFPDEGYIYADVRPFLKSKSNHATEHADGGSDEINTPLSLDAIPDTLTGKDADTLDGKHASDFPGNDHEHIDTGPSRRVYAVYAP